MLENFDKETKTKIYIVGGLFAGFIAYKLYKRIKATAAAAEQNAAVAKLQTTDKSSVATLTDEQAKVYANQLYSAMASVGTEESTIDGIVARLKNGQDWLKVYKAFGAKPYGVYGAPMDTWYWTSSSEPLDLMGWFRKELSGSRLTDIENKLLNYGII